MLINRLPGKSDFDHELFLVLLQFELCIPILLFRGSWSDYDDGNVDLIDVVYQMVIHSRNEAVQET